MIYFVTGNKHKFAEAREIIPELKRLDLDVPEIQELEPRKIIQAKLAKIQGRTLGSLKVRPWGFVVEDVSLEIAKLNGLPGPLVKWFEKTIGQRGMYKLAPNSKANIIATLGYKEANKLYFFKGVVKGSIVAPRGTNGFGFDVIFQPLSSDKTFAQMTRTEKARFSHRAKAFRKLKKFLY